MLSGNEIRKQMELGNIVIDPFIGSFGANSVNLRLGKKMFRVRPGIYDICKPITRDDVEEMDIPEYPIGATIYPGILYIGCTIEKAGSQKFVPKLDGRSSTGRHGVCVHITAGFGDRGFESQWTLEIHTIYPMKIYPYVEIAQIYFDPADGEDGPIYQGRYKNQDGPTLSKGLEIPKPVTEFQGYPVHILNSIDTVIGGE